MCRNNKEALRELHLFAGAGGGILGGVLLGHTCVCAVEIEPYCRKVLLQRQRDGILPKFPIWDDVRTFDGKPWRGLVNVVCGGFPCQDISIAGKGAGIDGERSGLWGEMARIVHEVGPQYVFVENSPMLTIRGLDRVLRDLAEMGYDAEWGVLGACHVGAKHKRERLWILANANSSGRKKLYPSTVTERQELNTRLSTKGNMADTYNADGRGQCRGFRSLQISKGKWDLCSVFDQPEPVRMAHGVANRTDRLKALGNGQVPQVVALAWETLSR